MVKLMVMGCYHPYVLSARGKMSWCTRARPRQPRAFPSAERAHAAEWICSEGKQKQEEFILSLKSSENPLGSLWCCHIRNKSESAFMIKQMMNSYHTLQSSFTNTEIHLLALTASSTWVKKGWAVMHFVVTHYCTFITFPSN